MVMIISGNRSLADGLGRLSQAGFPVVLVVPRGMEGFGKSIMSACPQRLLFWEVVLESVCQGMPTAFAQPEQRSWEAPSSSQRASHLRVLRPSDLARKMGEVLRSKQNGLSQEKLMELVKGHGVEANPALYGQSSFLGLLEELESKFPQHIVIEGGGSPRRVGQHKAVWHPTVAPDHVLLGTSEVQERVELLDLREPPLPSALAWHDDGFQLWVGRFPERTVTAVEVRQHFRMWGQISCIAVYERHIKLAFAQQEIANRILRSCQKQGGTVSMLGHRVQIRRWGPSWGELALVGGSMPAPAPVSASATSSASASVTASASALSAAGMWSSKSSIGTSPMLTSSTNTGGLSLATTTCSSLEQDAAGWLGSSEAAAGGLGWFSLPSSSRLLLQPPPRQPTQQGAHVAHLSEASASLATPSSDIAAGAQELDYRRSTSAVGLPCMHIATDSALPVPQWMSSSQDDTTFLLLRNLQPGSDTGAAAAGAVAAAPTAAATNDQDAASSQGLAGGAAEVGKPGGGLEPGLLEPQQGMVTTRLPQPRREMEFANIHRISLEDASFLLGASQPAVPLQDAPDDAAAAPGAGKPAAPGAAAAAEAGLDAGTEQDVQFHALLQQFIAMDGFDCIRVAIESCLRFGQRYPGRDAPQGAVPLSTLLLQLGGRLSSVHETGQGGRAAVSIAEAAAHAGVLAIGTGGAGAWACLALPLPARLRPASQSHPAAGERQRWLADPSPPLESQPGTGAPAAAAAALRRLWLDADAGEAARVPGAPPAEARGLEAGLPRSGAAFDARFHSDPESGLLLGMGHDLQQRSQSEPAASASASSSLLAHARSQLLSVGEHTGRLAQATSAINQLRIAEPRAAELDAGVSHQPRPPTPPPLAPTDNAPDLLVPAGLDPAAAVLLPAGSSALQLPGGSWPGKG